MAAGKAVSLVLLACVCLAADNGNTTPPLGAMILVPAGRYHLTMPSGPPRPFRTLGYFIDAHLVTNRQYLDFIGASGHRPGPGFDFDRARRHPLLPATGVSHGDAAAYAAFHGKRLPTADEWQLAAQSLNAKNIYPWGLSPKHKACNALYQSPGGLTAVFAYPPNRLGMYDPAGNAFEWTATPYPSAAGSPHALITLKGGAWTTQAADMMCAQAIPFPAHRSLHWLGFRCVRAAAAKEQAKAAYVMRLVLSTARIACVP